MYVNQVDKSMINIVMYIFPKFDSCINISLIIFDRCKISNIQGSMQKYYTLSCACINFYEATVLL